MDILKMETIPLFHWLQYVKDKLPRGEKLIVMGEFNAKRGEKEDSECEIGPYGLGKRNKIGDMFAELSIANGLNNTCFKQPHNNRYTWISPGHRYRNQILHHDKQ